jgi:hypothetical protein
VTRLEFFIFGEKFFCFIGFLEGNSLIFCFLFRGLFFGQSLTLEFVFNLVEVNVYLQEIGVFFIDIVLLSEVLQEELKKSSDSRI